MNKARLVKTFVAVKAWCEGGPTPEREDVLAALQYLIQIAPPLDEVADPVEPAPNVIPFRSKK